MAESAMSTRETSGRVSAEGVHDPNLSLPTPILLRRESLAHDPSGAAANGESASPVLTPRLQPVTTFDGKPIRLLSEHEHGGPGLPVPSGVDGAATASATNEGGNAVPSGKVDEKKHKQRSAGDKSNNMTTNTNAVSSSSSSKKKNHHNNNSEKDKMVPPSALLAMQVSDPKKWFLPIMAPPLERAAAAAAAAPEAPADDDSQQLGGVGGDGGGLPVNADDAEEVATLLRPPIEERISLRELKLIMNAFSDDDAISASVTGGLSSSRRDSAATAAARPIHYNIEEVQLAPGSGRSNAGAGGRERGASTATVSDNDHHSAGEDPLQSMPWGAALAAATVEKNGDARASRFSASAGAPTRPVSPSDLTELLVDRDALGRPIVHRTYNRELSQDAFVRMMQSVVTSATTAEVLELLNKVDYEASGRTSWSELATFLVSQNQHRTHMKQANFAFVETPDPESFPTHCLHQQATCMAVFAPNKLLVTGGNEGNVHAWGLATLTYRGLLFSVPEWIVGLHFGDQGRFLYVITMNRQVFTLDGSSFEVLRVYRGRPVDASDPSGVAYAGSTMRTLRVGGVAPPKEKAESVTAQRKRQEREAKKRDQLLTDMLSNKSSLAASGAAVVTTGMAYETLNVDVTRLTGKGRGPYVERVMQEGVLAGLVSPVTASAHNHTRLQDEVLLLGTQDGSVHIYALPQTYMKKVLMPLRVLDVHSAQINKLAFLFSLEALLSCSDDGTVRMTSMVNGELMREFSAPYPDGHSAVHDFDVDPALKMLVTMGSERRGLVWEFSQESPIADLDEHAAPGRCCAFFRQQRQVITTASDGTINIFDVSGFHLAQTLHLDATHSPLLATVDEVRQCLVCARRHPYHLRVKRQAMAACPPKYMGHVAHMLTSLYTSIFDMIVTIDSDATAMTWARKSGKNIFVFPLKDFSDSAAIEATRLSCAALDGLQRRLLTGFRNGAVVVWNAVNGQAINFITAGMSEEDVAALAPVSGDEAKKKQAQQRERPWQRPPSSFAPPLDYLKKQREGVREALRNNARSGSGGAPGGRPASSRRPDTGASADGGAGGGGEGAGVLGGGGDAGREVTALGSLVRHGTTFIMFAVRNVLYTVRESANFTVADARKWHMPSTYGEILCLSQVNPQIMACGTSSGAVVFYHVLSENQDGAALWVKEVSYTDGLLGHGTGASSTANSGAAAGRLGATTSGAGSVAGTTSPRRSSGGCGAAASPAALSATFSNTQQRRSTVQAQQQQQQSLAGGAGYPVLSLHNVSARVTRLFPLTSVSANLMLAVHGDGTVALWQTFRRVYLGMVSLTSAGVDEGKEGGGGIIADIDAGCQHLVFADDGGNVHVCNMAFKALRTPEEEALAIALPNPAVYTVVRGANGGAGVTRRGRARSMRGDSVSVVRPSEQSPSNDNPNATVVTATGTVVSQSAASTPPPSVAVAAAVAAITGKDDNSDFSTVRGGGGGGGGGGGAGGGGGGGSGNGSNNNSLGNTASTPAPSDAPDGGLTPRRTSTEAGASEPTTPEKSAGKATSHVAVFPERLIYTFERFSRTLVFGSGMANLVSVLIVAPPPPKRENSSGHKDDAGQNGSADGDFKSSQSPDPLPAKSSGDKQAEAGTSPAATSAENATPTEGQQKSAASPEEVAARLREPIIVCTAKENYTRVFTMRGEPVGDLGAGTYDLRDENTFSYFGALVTKHGEHLPSTLEYANDQMAYYDYLEETVITMNQQQNQVLAQNKRGRGRSFRSNNNNYSNTVSGANATTGGYNNAATFLAATSQAPHPVDGDGATRALSVAGAGAASPVTGDHSPHTSTQSPQTGASPVGAAGPATAAGDGAAPASTAAATVANAATTERVALGSQLKSLLHHNTDVEVIRDPAPLTESGDPVDDWLLQQQNTNNIDTFIKKSTKQRFLDQRRYRGIVQKQYAAQVQKQANALVRISDRASSGPNGGGGGNSNWHTPSESLLMPPREAPETEAAQLHFTNAISSTANSRPGTAPFSSRGASADANGTQKIRLGAVPSPRRRSSSSGGKKTGDGGSDSDDGDGGRARANDPDVTAIPTVDGESSSSGSSKGGGDTEHGAPAAADETVADAATLLHATSRPRDADATSPASTTSKEASDKKAGAQLRPVLPKPGTQRRAGNDSSSTGGSEAAAAAERRTSLHPAARPRRDLFPLEHRPSTTRPPSVVGGPQGSSASSARGWPLSSSSPSSPPPRTREELLRRHLDEKKRRLESTTLADSTRRALDREMRTLEGDHYVPPSDTELAEHNRVGAEVAAVLQQHNSRARGGGAAAAQATARSYCQQVAHNMVVLPVSPVTPAFGAARGVGLDQSIPRKKH